MRWKTGKLSHAASNLLLAIIQARAEGIDRLKAGEWKEEAGIRLHRLWEKATRELEASGLARLEKRGQSYVVTAFALNGSVSDESVRLNVDVSTSVYTNIHGTDAKPAKRDEGDQFLAGLGIEFSPPGPKSKNSPPGPNFREGDGKYGPTGSNSPKNSPPGPNSNIVLQDQILENDPPGPNLRRGCVEVDRMDDSGDLARANSPAQQRRRQQVAVVQRVWGEFFPTQPALIAENAKRFLTLSDQSAEAVYDLLEYVKSRNPGSPLQYALSTARNKSQPEARPEAPPSPAFVPGPVESDPVEEKRVVSAAVRQRIKQWRRMHPHDDIPADLYE